MSESVKARRLSDEEGQRLLVIVRRGEPKATRGAIRYRRAMGVPASASGNSVPAIARLVAADEVTVREVLRRFNELGMRALDSRWAGGRPRRISAEDEAILVEAAIIRPGRHPAGSRGHRAPKGRPHRLPAIHRKTGGVAFHGCYSIGEDRL
jgi:hypothetical protein